MSRESQRTCASCGNDFSGTMEFCPVCMLRKGLAGDIESGEASVEEAAKPTIPEQAVQRFEHYELVTADGFMGLEQTLRKRNFQLAQARSVK